MDALAHVRDVARGRILDLKLTAKNHTVSIGGWVTPSAREMATSGFVGGLENFIPVKVEWRYLTEASVDPAPMPSRVEVVSLESLNDLYFKSVSTKDTYCAFYDSFASIAFSENADVLALRQYRITYEDTSDITLANVSQYVELPDIFITLCAYETALICLNQVRNSSPDWADERERLRGDFTAQAMIWDQRFNKWRSHTWGNKIVSKGGKPLRYKYGGR